MSDIPNSLHQLTALAQQMQQHAAVLPPHVADFGDEHIGYVVDTSGSILEKLQNMMQSCLSAGGPIANPLESREIRHDMRNLIAVIKGFSELMQMDANAEHPANNSLTTLRTLSDQFVEILDQIKATSDGDAAAAVAG